ncbi:hypothetical protein [Agathobaculum butyriciproducens]|jgi:hypothetical protein|uniref:hypothetical protein n=1 Tax=Agathobaculum butyriciproducens TaxID=1628085 RepID=UPI003A90A78C
MDWKTSNHMDGSEIRDSIGLQYFAEDGNTSDTGADMDGFNGDDFLAALEGNDDLENQQTAAEGEEETVQDGAEDQRTEEQQEEPENQPPEGGEVPPETVEQPVQTVPLVYNGQQILLPADAVQALTGALGANPVELLQKGMNYDRKAEREMRVLDQYAEAAGMNRQQYLEQLEGARNEQLLSAEIEKCRAEFPETPDAALKAIAEGRMASQRAAAAQAAEQQRAELTAMQQRIDQTVEQAREEADARAWEEYVSLSGVKSFEEVPKRVLELVQQEAMTPVAAHWRYQAELNQQAVRIAEKNQTNRQTSPGSVAGNESDTSDPFLRGLLGL